MKFCRLLDIFSAMFSTKFRMERYHDRQSDIGTAGIFCISSTHFWYIQVLGVIFIICDTLTMYTH